MDDLKENRTLLDFLHSAVSVTLDVQDVNRTSTTTYHRYNYYNVTSPTISKTENLDNSTSQIINKNITSTLSSLIITTTSTAVPANGDSQNSDASILAKITALLVITAVVLVVSYRFVVRLFLGYADSKEDVFPDGFSDDEDSGIFKRSPDDYDYYDYDM